MLTLPQVWGRESAIPPAVTGPPALESDAERHNYLQLDGWTVLRFTWHSLDTMPDLVIRTLRKLSATCTQ